MPFIDIGFEVASTLLSDASGSILRELLQTEKINPLEAELLQNVVSINQGENQEEAQERIREILIETAGEEAERALNRILKFATSTEKRVSWVLFSRTIQFLPFDKGKPLEGYQSQAAEILKIITTERLFKKIT